MESILLIEDNVAIRENTVELLELSGYHVLVAENGREGVVLAKENMPNLILCDIMMPELNGYEVFNELSKDPSTAKIPFIFVTASAEKSEMKKGLEMGAWGYISKPFEAPQVLSAIKGCIRPL